MQLSRAGGSRLPIFVEQAKQLGASHVQVAERAIGRVDDVLVMGGDYDPVTGDDVRRLVASHRRTGSRRHDRLDRAGRSRGCSRVVRKGSRLVEVVEDVDMLPEIGDP